MFSQVINISFIKKIVIFLLTIVTILVLVFLFFSKKKDIEQELLSEDNYLPIRVWVYNGCGFDGVANNLKNYLHPLNVDVVYTRSAQRFIYDETIIVVKKLDELELKRLQRITGITNVIYATNDTFEVPFIIIAGKDYNKYITPI